MPHGRVSLLKSNIQLEYIDLFRAKHAQQRLFHGLIDAEAGRRVPRRELLERLQELGRHGGGVEHEEVPANHPGPLGVRRDVGVLVGIGA